MEVTPFCWILDELEIFQGKKYKVHTCVVIPQKRKMDAAVKMEETDVIRSSFLLSIFHLCITINSRKKLYMCIYSMVIMLHVCLMNNVDYLTPAVDTVVGPWKPGTPENI